MIRVCPVCRTVIPRETLEQAESPATDWGLLDSLAAVPCPHCHVVRWIPRNTIREELEAEGG